MVSGVVCLFEIVFQGFFQGFVFFCFVGYLQVYMDGVESFVLYQFYYLFFDQFEDCYEGDYYVEFVFFQGE